MNPHLSRLFLVCAVAISWLGFAGGAMAAPLFDPPGDTFGTEVPQLDIISYSAVFLCRTSAGTSAGTLFTVGFAGPIAPASAFAPNSVVGYIDLDTDANPATGGDSPWGGPVPGGNSWINFFVNAGDVPPPLIALGDELFVDLFSEAINPGFVDVRRTSDSSLVGQLAITYGASSFSFFLPETLLPPGSVANFNYGILVGTFFEPTDRAPNGPFPAQVDVPEPATLTLCGIIGAGMMGSYWRRRRVL